MTPWLQLLIVPNAGPIDWSAGWSGPTGPENVTGVSSGVTRRLYGESSTCCHLSSTSSTSTIVTPWAASALLTFSWVIGVLPSV